EQRLGRSNAAGGNDAPEAHWQERVRVVPASQPLLAPAMDADVLATVQQALLDQVQCELTYQRRTDPKPATYPVHPLALVQRGALLYLVCTIKTYSDIKLLAVHRMTQALLLADAVRVPAGFNLDAYLDSGAMGWKSGAEQVNLSIAFDAAVAEHLHETPLSTNQTLSDMSCGRVQLNASVPYTPQLLWWLRGFGAAAEVLGPESLRLAMRETADQLTRLYAD
ncbi:MAG: WYL domain-containing protein, partial [Rhodoferax sp.]|nr:WYL domain-containing protein [Rhodoferax sp.]